MENVINLAVIDSADRSLLKPQVVISATDHERLAALANAVLEHSPEVGEALQAEMDRALVVDCTELPADVVAMNARVAFRDETTGKVRTVRLVYPNEADIGEGLVSVLTPIGAALIGIAEGESIGWRTRTGDRRVLSILRVEQSQEGAMRNEGS